MTPARGPATGRWLAELPAGIPHLSGPFGVYDGRSMAAPGMMVFCDWDLWYIERGEVLWQLPSGSAVRARKGHFLLLPPRVPMRCRFVSPLVRHWFCHFSFRPVPASLTWSSVRADCFAEDPFRLVPLHATRQEAPGLWRAYRDFLRLDTASVPGEPWRRERALLGLVGQLAWLARRLRLRSQDGLELSEKTQMDPRLVAIFDAVRRQPRSVADLEGQARKVGCSLRHLERLCQAALGTTLKAYLTEIRLRHALRLYDHPPDGRRPSIKEASRLAGFPSPKALAYAFKKVFGIAQRSYLRQHTLA